jgi:ribulose-phosphate 3-epimerase
LGSTRSNPLSPHSISAKRYKEQHLSSRQVKLEASVACAHLTRLENDLRELKDAGIDLLHIDIMDGRFVNNFCLDFSMMEAIREVTDTPMDCHLMVEDPERYVDRAIAAGAQYVSVHVEATRHVQRVLEQIRNGGAKPGIALNPGTAIHNLDYILDNVDMVTVMTVNPGYAGQPLVTSAMGKIRDVRRMLDDSGHKAVDIQVDGNVSFKNIPAMVSAGASMLVGGTSSVFHKDYSIPQAIQEIRNLVQQIELTQ